MRDNQLNFLNMVKTVIAMMNLNNGVWTGNLKITAHVAGLQLDVDAIEALEGIQSDSIDGATTSEHSAWNVAANCAEHVCFGLKAYYLEKDDDIMFEKVNYTHSDFIYGQRNEAKDRMKKVYEISKTIDIDDLKDCNVIASDITDLDDAIKAFDTSIPVRNVMRTSTTAATKELPAYFTSLRKRFKKLDNYAGGLKKTNLPFFDAYTKAREIINLGKSMVAEELQLMPREFKAIFGDKLKIGYWVTVRNHSDFPATAYLTDDTANLLVKNEVIIDANAELKLEVPKDFKGVFGHWLMVYNPSGLDDVHVTVILSKKKSQSSAMELASKVK
jgi:hypothetical protein